MPDDQPCVEDLEARLDQPLLLERVAHLHAGALVVVGALGAEAGRGQHAGPADPVATGRRAEQHGQVPRPRRSGQHQAVVREEPEAEDVDERIVLKGGVEHGLSAHRRDAHGVPIAGNPGDHSFGDPAAAGVVQRTEPQRDPSARSGGHRRRRHRAGCRPPRWRPPRRARWPMGGCGSRSGRRPRCRRRRR